MENFWDVVKLMILVSGSLMALFMILVSIPQSKLSVFALKAYGMLLYSLTGLLVIYVINPADLIPDIIPVLGQVDDAAALITAFFSGCFGWIANNRAENYKLKL